MSKFRMGDKVRIKERFLDDPYFGRCGKKDRVYAISALPARMHTASWSPVSYYHLYHKDNKNGDIAAKEYEIELATPRKKVKLKDLGL